MKNKINVKVVENLSLPPPTEQTALILKCPLLEFCINRTTTLPFLKTFVGVTLGPTEHEVKLKM